MSTGIVEFRQLQEVEFSPTCFILWLRAILTVRDVRGPEWSFIRCQKLGLSGEIPIVVLDSSETDRGPYVLLMC